MLELHEDVFGYLKILVLKERLPKPEDSLVAIMIINISDNDNLK